MYLKRLEVQGFKTFAQKTVVEFQPGITAIVGSNGTGKSNLADAVRWVLGEQSFASLRCKRSEELLYSGGGRRSPAGLAEVSLTIDNRDRLLALDFDEVTITRRATRGGDNEYFINRARVRLRDLQEATEPLGGSYTIINQGLVDAALTLRPEERRRLFEDAAEIGAFEQRKVEAERRLREMDANVQRVDDLLAEGEPRLRALKRQAGLARQQRELHDALQALLARHYAAQWYTACAAADEHALAALAHEAALAEARTAQGVLVAELRELRETLRLRRAALATLHQQSAALHARAEAAQRELAIGDERLYALARRAEELERARHALAQRRAEAESEHALATSALAAVAAARDLRRAALASAESMLADREQARRALAGELRAAQELSLRATAAQVEIEGRATQLVAGRARLERERAELVAALRQTDERLAEAQQARELAHAALTAVEAQVAAAQRAEAMARDELANVQAARAQADEAHAAARRAQADIEARFESLNRLARAYTGTFAGVRAAMQWAERSGRADFALVSSIIRSPVELEQALEVALGSRLQNIVVEHWHEAEAAIAELKRSAAGRATFLPLDTLKAQPSALRDELRADPAVRGIAAALVEYDERYRAVVWHLLGRVVIVDDLAAARRALARLAGGWTLVTMDGAQVSSGGAVTGGAQTKESGVLRRERELRELPGRVEAARVAAETGAARVRELSAASEAGATQLRALGQQVAEHIRQRKQAQAALEAAERRAAQQAQERRWQGEREAKLADELAPLLAQEAALAGQRAEAAAHASAAEDQLALVRARQEEVAAADRAAQEELAALRAALVEAEAQLKAQQTVLASHGQAAERAVRQLAEGEAALAALNDERTELLAVRARAAQTEQELLTVLASLRAEIEPAEAALRADEVSQKELEQREATAASALLAHEATASSARHEAQRALDRKEHLFERALADGIELAEGARDAEPATTPGDLSGEVARVRERILRLGAVNPLALEEYEEAAERQRFLREQVADLRAARTALHDLIDELVAAMRARFTQTFSAVAAEFERAFTRLFGGGSASLQLVGGAASGRNGSEPGDEATSDAAPYGVEIVARPPGKRAQNIALLSGGERTLTASALLFAILAVNPSPFCILDEVDAALDESNVGRFRAALSELTGATQFIVITHNRATIEAADVLYGVSMGDDGVSKTISLRVEHYVDADS